jgi:hypothetical protein
MHFPSPPYVPHAPPISSSLITITMPDITKFLVLQFRPNYIYFLPLSQTFHHSTKYTVYDVVVCHTNTHSTQHTALGPRGVLICPTQNSNPLLSLFRRLEAPAATPHAAMRCHAWRRNFDTSRRIKTSNGHACATTADYVLWVRDLHTINRMIMMVMMIMVKIKLKFTLEQATKVHRGRKEV